MLSPAMIDRLNKQINLEQYSSNLYLQMSAWCDHQGYTGSAAFLKEHAAEELTHMHKLFDYVSETGALATLGAVAAPVPGPGGWGMRRRRTERLYRPDVPVRPE